MAASAAEPAGPAGAGEREAWQKLEDDKVLRSRFHHLRVVFDEEGEASLLPVGIKGVEGEFLRGALVEVRNGG